MFTHTDIVRIYAELFAYNIGSCRVLEKADFQYEGTLRSNAVRKISALHQGLCPKGKKVELKRIKTIGI